MAPSMLDHSPRGRVAMWIAIRSQEPDLTNTEIAKRIGIARGYLQELLRRATTEGWLKFDDPMSRIEYEIVPKVVDNLNHFLDKKDKQVTIEAAKGTIFAQFKESKAVPDVKQTVLALKIELPPQSLAQPAAPVNGPLVVEGTVVGKPRISE